VTPVILIINGITLVLAYGGALLGLFCMIDALFRRPDAFAAADRQTKGTWVGITIACAAGLALGLVSPLFEPQSLLWLAALVGVFVYLVDVRPRLREVSGPGRW
jgi:multisubunit Na+/H+ antiporter MnhG subunit